MTRTVLAYEAPDISALARTLHGRLATLDHVPGHVELLNILARAAGFRNFQHLRADRLARRQIDATPPPAPPPPAPPPADHARCAKALRLYDAQGRLARWPKKRNQQELCLWVLWSRLPAGETFAEKIMNERVNRLHLFGDHALLRRELIELGLFRRTVDGREYSRIEQAPPPELRVLLALLRGRAQSLS
ncbi:DUF2087 domain-containing protein [Ancylobacter amanitiformis]|uniref:DUF2087 domain-containing protein n=1 Tax=Ancylobacter amanitiformis TaxID=217069 RepID=A0ABU0LU47_9HYPH|nr:DUF2087 domain-containing protein [Ancylobacter amanitiformis]MDQ0512231.1 hypothetical protein [Ancylobacter amanitiformis]